MLVLVSIVVVVGADVIRVVVAVGVELVNVCSVENTVVGDIGDVH